MRTILNMSLYIKMESHRKNLYIICNTGTLVIHNILTNPKESDAYALSIMDH